MGIYLLKLFTSAAVIVVVSELGKRVSWLAALIASLPLTSMIAICWLYFETRDLNKVITLSNGIFWAIIPSLLFFLVFSQIFKLNVSFLLGLTISVTVMFIGYLVYVGTVKQFNIQV